MDVDGKPLKREMTVGNLKFAVNFIPFIAI